MLPFPALRCAATTNAHHTEADELFILFIAHRPIIHFKAHHFMLLLFSTKDVPSCHVDALCTVGDEKETSATAGREMATSKARHQLLGSKASACIAIHPEKTDIYPWMDQGAAQLRLGAPSEDQEETSAGRPAAR